MCNEQQNEDQILTSVAERYKVKVIRREDLKEDMITFENAGVPDLLICLEPDPSAVKPDNNSLKSRLTTLSNKERTRLAGVIEQVSAILFGLDPIGINCETNLDEYDPEACAIISTLKNKVSVDDVAAVVIDTFKHYFDRDISANMTDLEWTNAVQGIWNICTTHGDSRENGNDYQRNIGQPNCN